MDSVWFWLVLSWRVGVAWFETWPECLQAPALLVMVFAMVWLAWVSMTMVARAYRWIFVRSMASGPTLAEKQAQQVALSAELTEAEHLAPVDLRSHADVAYALGEVDGESEVA